MPDSDPVRAIHLFSDKKFIPWVKQTFDATGWTSSYIILNPQLKSTILVIDINTIEVSTDEGGTNKALEMIAKNEIVFHYFLDNIKADIIQKTPTDIMHCWCFYGAEIYQQTNLFRKDIYGPATRHLLRTLPEIKFRYDLRKYYYLIVKRKKPPIASLLKAIPRIHSILWYVEEEMEKLNTRIKLPQWQFFQFFSFKDIVPPGTSSTNRESRKILIGNSATIENNHVDVLEAIIKLHRDTPLFSLPMTYGQFSRYQKKIKALFKKELGERVFFLESHMKLEEYYQFLQQHPTAIFLHYRQQGLGNILYLLYTGTKVYLSRHNVVYLWLTRNNLKVYIFEDQFSTDYEDNNLVLDDVTAAQNKQAIISLLDHSRNTDTLLALETEIMKQRKNLTS